MKKLTLIFLSLIFIGCSYIDYPDKFIKSIKFTSNVIDIEKMQISSKDELIEFIYNISDKNYYGEIIGYRLEIITAGDYSENKLLEYIIYITPFSDNKSIIDKTVYKSGMPIILQNTYSMYPSSKQHVILIKGKPEWADSSYKGFTILPVANSGDEGDLDFYYTIKEQKSQG